MDACCTPTPASTAPETPVAWWRDRAVLVPVCSGIALLIGLLSQWAGAAALPQALFWVGLLLGGSTFVPGALRGLLTSGRPGISVLMTISAIGAVLLGHVAEAAALAFLYSIAEALEDKAMDRARSGLRALLTLVPQSARIQREGRTIEVEVKELQVKDLMVVRPGERVATDGIVREGHSSLDTSAITGESIPLEVATGDQVSAGSISTSGALLIETTATGTDNSLTMIVELVEQTQAEKGQRARLADRIARPLVPGVLILAVLVALVGSLLGDPGVWLTRALVVLVAASPCALAISVPVTVISAIGAATRFGVVIKSGAAFERFGGIRHLAVDKTGTLTRNRPTVVAVRWTAGTDREQVLDYAAGVERHSTHPLATAITLAAPEAHPAREVVEHPGQGITGLVAGERIAVGSPRWLAPGPLAAEIEALEKAGMTVVIVHRDGSPIGALGVRDELRPEVPWTIAALNHRGIAVTMLTGDNDRTARALAAQAGIEDVRSQLRPAEKSAAVTELSASRPTAMIGDGINDAPALAAADVGIAMGATGSDAAIESADIAFTGHDLRLIPQALAHARQGRTIMNQNIVLSLLIIIVLLPLAISGVLGLAAVVLFHELAEVVVIANGLRAARTRPIRRGTGPAATATDDPRTVSPAGIPTDHP